MSDSEEIIQFYTALIASPSGHTRQGKEIRTSEHTQQELRHSALPSSTHCSPTSPRPWILVNADPFTSFSTAFIL
jgi:hypothetical protein